MKNRPNCQQPTNCGAKGAGHCRRCHMAAAVKANWQDPEFRARNAAAVKANWQDPEFRARNAAAVKANWQDPEFRAKQSAATRAKGTGVQVPSWVPAGLVDDYIDIAVLQGEEMAASAVRRMKRESA